jgi:hypothetical protein
MLNLFCMGLCHWGNGDRLGPVDFVTSIETRCRPIWSHWVWLWVCVMVGLGSYRYYGCDRLGFTASRLCFFVSLVYRQEFGAWSSDVQTLKHVNPLPTPPQFILTSLDKFQSDQFGSQPVIPPVGHIHPFSYPPLEATRPGGLFYPSSFSISCKKYGAVAGKVCFRTWYGSSCVLKCLTLWGGKLIWIICQDSARTAQ